MVVVIVVILSVVDWVGSVTGFQPFKSLLGTAIFAVEKLGAGVEAILGDECSGGRLFCRVTLTIGLVTNAPVSRCVELWPYRLVDELAAIPVGRFIFFLRITFFR